MSLQPIKPEINFEQRFSNEIRLLIKTTVQDIITDFPSNNIEPVHFIMAGLSNHDCMMYKMVNGFLTSVGIENLYKKIYENISDNKFSFIHTKRATTYSSDLRNVFMKCIKIADSMNSKYITSDMVLLAIMEEQLSPLYDIFIEESLTHEILKDLSLKLHDTTNAIAKTDEQKWEKLIALNDSVKRYTIGLDLSSVDDDKTGVIISAVNNIFGEGNLSQKTNKRVPSCCFSLNELAERKKIESIIGRDREISSIIKVLNRKKCNNVLLIGESGVGKTAIVEGIAKKIVDGTAPYAIKNCEIIQLNSLSLMADTQYRGIFESKMLGLIKELESRKNAILFIDNIHLLVSEHQKNEFDFGGFLSSIFEGGNTKVIATTTPKGFHNAIETNAAIKSKFQTIKVEKPTLEECLGILRGVQHSYEEYHGIKYSDASIRACVTLSNRYITDRCLPVSAIDIMDEVGSNKKILLSEPNSIKTKREEIARLEKEKENLIKEDKISELQNTEYKINGLKIEISDFYNAAGNLRRDGDNIVVTEEDVYQTVSEHTNIPIQKITATQKKSLAKIDEVLKKNIVGQDEAINTICRAIKRNKVGLSPKNRPILSCLCVGGSGVGKTLLAKKLAEEVFGDEKCLVRFDMSEYSDKTAVNKLIGASAGYVGYNEGGLLTEAIKNKKHAVLLIDEIEKSTDEIFNLFLQVLDEGTLTDNTGQKVDFKNVIIILTSNVGAKKAANEKSIGFEVDDNTNKRTIIEKELKNKFPPEFINRLDEIVYFNNLTDDNLKKIIRIELNKLSDRINEIGHSFNYDDSVVEYIFKIIEKQKEYGARPILRTIQNEIENKITDLLLENDYENHIFKATFNEYLKIK